MNAHERAEMLAAVELDFPLTASDRRELDVHLASCLACRTTVASVRADAGLLREIATVDPAPRVRVEFAAAVARPQHIGVAMLFDLRPWLRLAAVAALLAALATGLVVAGSVGDHRELPGPNADASQRPPGRSEAPPRVVGLPGRTERVCSTAAALRVQQDTAYIVCGDQLQRAAAGGEGAAHLDSPVAAAAPDGPDVWAVNTSELLRLDALSLALRGRRAGAGGDAVASGAGAVWVLRVMTNELLRVDPSSLTVVARIGVAHNPADVLVAFGHIWVSNRDGGTVQEIDPATNRVVETFHVGAGPAGLAASVDAVWVANDADGTASRIDPTTGRSLTIDVAPAVHTSDLPSITALGTTVWVADAHDDLIAQIDDATATIRRWIAPPNPIGSENDIVAIAASGRSVWLLDTSSQLQEIVLP